MDSIGWQLPRFNVRSASAARRKFHPHCDHQAARGFPVLVHLKGLAIVLLK